MYQSGVIEQLKVEKQDLKAARDEFEQMYEKAQDAHTRLAAEEDVTQVKLAHAQQLAEA